MSLLDELPADPYAFGPADYAKIAERARAEGSPFALELAEQAEAAAAGDVPSQVRVQGHVRRARSPFWQAMRALGGGL